MDIAYMATTVAFVLYVIAFIALPLTVLFDMITFIIYLTKLKSDTVRRRKAETLFMIASACLTVNIAAVVLGYITLRIFG